MRDDLDDRTDLDRRNTGMKGGTIAAIIAALVIIGALFMWGPWSDDNSNTAVSTAPVTTPNSASTTTGQASTAPAPATAASPPTHAAPATSDSPANPAPTTR